MEYWKYHLEKTDDPKERYTKTNYQPKKESKNVKLEEEIRTFLNEKQDEQRLNEKKTNKKLAKGKMFYVVKIFFSMTIIAVPFFVSCGIPVVFYSVCCICSGFSCLLLGKFFGIATALITFLLGLCLIW
eukprot:gene2216-2390_t